MSDQNPLTNEQIKQELLKQRKTIKALEERWPKFIQNTDEVLHGYKVKLDEHEKEINAYKLQPQGADTEKSTLTDTERLLVQDAVGGFTQSRKDQQKTEQSPTFPSDPTRNTFPVLPVAILLGTWIKTIS